jgi:hypothetical protein
VRKLVPSLEGRTLLMLFRLGHAAVPEVRSLRRAAEAAVVSPGSDTRGGTEEATQHTF